jgi:predicted small lipoprotein YifL
MQLSWRRPLGRSAGRAALVIVAACSLAACGQKFEKVPDAEVDATQRAFAEGWGAKIMTAWSKGEYPTVGDEAVPEFRAGHNNVARQKAAAGVFKRNVGDFKSMTFYEAQRTVPPKLTIYRFKGQFENGVAEVRVVLDRAGKIAGHWVKPWRDELN